MIYRCGTSLLAKAEVLLEGKKTDKWVLVSNKENSSRMVLCVKLKVQRPAMLYQPFQDSLGQRIYEEISLDAWKEWIEHSKMIVNEYRLDLGTAETHTNLKKQCEEFLFGEEEKVLPPDFVPDEK